MFNTWMDPSKLTISSDHIVRHNHCMRNVFFEICCCSFFFYCGSLWCVMLLPVSGLCFYLDVFRSIHILDQSSGIFRPETGFILGEWHAYFYVVYSREMTRNEGSLLNFHIGTFRQVFHGSISDRVHNCTYLKTSKMYPITVELCPCDEWSLVLPVYSCAHCCPHCWDWRRPDSDQTGCC